MKIEVAIGEVIDKVSILLIKLIKIKDSEKKIHIKNELTELITNSEIKQYKGFEKIFDLIDINSQLWDVEDAIRIKEKKQDFGSDFIKLARSVYVLNDKRFEIKNEINQINNSKINEVKSYEKYL